jgi:carboxypeptidase Q
MTIARFAVVVLPLLSASFAQQPATQQLDPQLRSQLEQIQTAVLRSDYAWRHLAYLCNNIGPRPSGSPHAEAAVRYVADEMRKLGTDVRLHKVLVPHWVRGVETAELVEWPGQPAGTTQKVVVTALGASVPTSAAGITAEVLAVHDVEELRKLDPAQVKGKIVLFTQKFDINASQAGFPFEAYSYAVRIRTRGAEEAAKLGAAASLIRSVGSANFRLPHTGGMFPDPKSPKIPAGAVSYEDADLIDHLVKQGKVRLKLTLTPQMLPDVESANVIADIKGSTNPEQVVLVSGHLDSWDLSCGALDDGTGIVASMQVLQTIKQLGLRPKRTIRFVAWMSEEVGVIGSNAYAKDFAADLSNHVGAIEMDNGAGHATGIVGHTSAELRTKLRPLTSIGARQGAIALQMAESAPGADLGELDRKGVPTFAPLNDARSYFHYHHTAADTLDKVDPKHLQENASVMAILAWFLANQ